MATLVSVDCEEGTLRRYECGGTKARLTHQATAVNGALSLTFEALEKFRVDPSPDFAVEPPPRPTNSPAAAGAIAQAA